MSEKKAKQDAPPAVDEELRQATIAVLREDGWDGLTLERVAEVAGRARSTLWRQGLRREHLIHALTGRLAEDFRVAMYPVLTAPGSGRERLVACLEAQCDLLERNLPLLLATDEAFHQETAPGQQPHYLHPLIRFLEEGAADGSLPALDDPVETADLAFNAVAWTYVHLRGKHGWERERARSRVVSLVLDGIGGVPAKQSTRKEKR